MSGAIDLGAVKARYEAAARAAAAPPRPVSSAVIDITEETFQAEVLDRSFQVPVLLDLWADWCEPCKQLSPILERLAEEAGGSWLLAKIDVDANPRISQALQVQSIPTVFAVIGGQLVPGFQGALPEAQVREFVTAVLDAAKQAGLTGASRSNRADGRRLTGAAEEPADPRFVAAETALDDGDFPAAIAAYEAILAAEPANVEAGLALRQVRLLERSVTLDSSVLAAGRRRSGRRHRDARRGRLRARPSARSTPRSPGCSRRFVASRPRNATDPRSPDRVLRAARAGRPAGSARPAAT